MIWARHGNFLMVEQLYKAIWEYGPMFMFYWTLFIHSLFTAFFICISLFHKGYVFVWLVLRAWCNENNGKVCRSRAQKLCSRLPWTWWIVGKWELQYVEEKFFLTKCVFIEKGKENWQKSIKESTCAIILCSTQFGHCLAVMLDCSITVYTLHRLLFRQ